LARLSEGQQKPVLLTSTLSWWMEGGLIVGGYWVAGLLLEVWEQFRKRRKEEK